MTAMRYLLLAVAYVVAAPVPLRADDIVERRQHAEAQRHYEAGEALLRGESYAEAVPEFRAAIQLDPQLVLAHYGLGQAYMALKLYPEAVAVYVRCREIFRERASLTQRERVQIDRDRRDQIRELKEMMRLLEQAAARNREPQPSRILQVEERIRVLESATLKGAEQSLQVPAWLSLALGSAYLRQGLLPDAEREYKQAVSVDPKMGAAYNNLAWVYMHMRRLDEAEQALRRAEKAGFTVSPQFKEELKRRSAATEDETQR